MKIGKLRNTALTAMAAAAMITLTACTGSPTSDDEHAGHSSAGESTAEQSPDTSGSEVAAEPDASATVIHALDTGFGPADVTVAAGETITVMNEGNMEHSIIIDGADISSGTLPAGESFSFTIDEPGVYDYICDLHPTMGGTITVE